MFAGGEKVDFITMDNEEVQDFASAVQDSLTADMLSSTKGIALANDTIHWCLEDNT